MPTPFGIRRPSFGVLAALVLALGVAPGPAAAHEFWLAATRYDPAPGQAVEVGAIAGTGFRGERKPWLAPHAVRFVARAARPLDLAKAAGFGDVVWARFAPADRGGAMLAFESDFTRIELPAAAFDAYLRDEGLTEPLAARRAAGTTTAGRERYRRCAKAWLAGDDAARAVTPAGLPLEIVPETLPGRASSLKLRLLWNGAPLAKARVKAWCAASSGGVVADPAARDSTPVAWTGETDARGTVTVPCSRAGDWMVSAVHMVPSANRAEADWESTWASLTFARPSAARAAR